MKQDAGPQQRDPAETPSFFLEWEHNAKTEPCDAELSATLAAAPDDASSRRFAGTDVRIIILNGPAISRFAVLHPADHGGSSCTLFDARWSRVQFAPLSPFVLPWGEIVVVMLVYHRWREGDAVFTQGISVDPRTHSVSSN